MQVIINDVTKSNAGFHLNGCLNILKKNTSKYKNTKHLKFMIKINGKLQKRQIIFRKIAPAGHIVDYITPKLPQ